ncbi:MAG: phosphatidic acid phosphatase [Dehalococcoidales bacterium]|nr:phosphatidic acid phosphatase [Dehalococcoidales bacterium]
MKDKLARLTSGIFNPFLLSIIVIILLAFKESTDTLYSLKWAGISLAFSALPVLLAVWWLVHLKKLDGVFNNPREQRNRIYVMATLLGAIGFAIMWVFDPPQLLRATFTAGLVAILVFMIINFFWKISLHTAFISATATLITLVYGAPGAITLLLLPAVGWSRIALKQHTISQVTAGAVCAAGIVLVVFWACGCV